MCVKSLGGGFLKARVIVFSTRVNNRFYSQWEVVVIFSSQFHFVSNTATFLQGPKQNVFQTQIFGMLRSTRW